MDYNLISIKDKEIVASHRDIALGTDNTAQHIKELIDKYKNDFEEFGVIRFETEKPLKSSTGGRPEITYYLNEQQTTLLFTYLRNSEIVRKFKVALVKEFYQMREMIISYQNDSLMAKYIKLQDEKIKLLEDLQKAKNKVVKPKLTFAMREELSNPIRQQKKYSDEEYELLITMCVEGVPLATVAKTLGRTHGSVLKKVSRMIKDRVLLSKKASDSHCYIDNRKKKI
ncbi:Rha family transcriptional regulator [Sulfurimonas sp.]|uniref:Rha family transcriptional regulator n=1 Tax=Sulfurimonas sp. TaxID=2022749 RepID=UPI003D098D43